MGAEAKAAGGGPRGNTAGRHHVTPGMSVCMCTCYICACCSLAWAGVCPGQRCAALSFSCCMSVCRLFVRLSSRRDGAARTGDARPVRLCVFYWCCWILWFIFVRVGLLLGLSDPRVYMYITFSGADSPRAVSRQTRPGYRSAAVRVPLPWRWRLLRYCSICGGCPRVAVVCVWVVGGGPRDFSCFFFLWCGRLPCWVRVASYW